MLLKAWTQAWYEPRGSELAGVKEFVVRFGWRTICVWPVVRSLTHRSYLAASVLALQVKVGVCVPVAPVGAVRVGTAGGVIVKL